MTPVLTFLRFLTAKFHAAITFFQLEWNILENWNLTYYNRNLNRYDFISGQNMANISVRI